VVLVHRDLSDLLCSVRPFALGLHSAPLRADIIAMASSATADSMRAVVRRLLQALDVDDSEEKYVKALLKSAYDRKVSKVVRLRTRNALSKRSSDSAQFSQNYKALHSLKSADR